MVYPEEPVPTDAPGRPEADPLPPPTTPAAGQSTEVRAVTRFLDEYYEAAPLTERIDAARFHRALLAWADERTLPPPGRTLTYATVRQRGIPVVRGHGNILQIQGLRPRPFVQHELARLEGTHHHLQLARQADEEQRTMTRDLAAQARSLAEEAINQLLPPAFEAVRAGLVDPDIRVRLQASEAILSRAVPRVKVKEIADEPIEARAIQARPGLVEIEALIRAQSASGSKQSASESKQGVTTAAPCPQGTAPGANEGG